jgi:hypothetical protein
MWELASSYGSSVCSQFVTAVHVTFCIVFLSTTLHFQFHCRDYILPFHSFGVSLKASEY